MRLAVRLVVLTSLALVVPLGGVAGAAEETVRITDRLEPAELRIAAGTTVRWVNRDDARHRPRSTSGPDRFDSGNLEPGDSFSFTFRLEGTYRYVDARDDEDAAYHGTIVVRAAGASGDGEEGAASSGAVRILDRRFSPASITVAAGGTVRWTNEDDRAHTVTARDGSFDSGSFGAGRAYSRRFPRAATVEYFCVLHPDMVGTVKVVGADGDAPPPAPAPSAAPAPAPPRGSVAIEMRDFDFAPATARAEVGQRVVWTNTGVAPHTATASDGSFDSGMVARGKRFSRVFREEGAYAYRCSLHPEMTGTLLVGAASDPPEGSPSATPPASVPASPAARSRALPVAPAGGLLPLSQGGVIAVILGIPLLLFLLVLAAVRPRRA